MKTTYLFLIISVYGNMVNGHFDMVVPDHKNVFDLNLYESVLDEELCEEQIRYIQQNEPDLLIEFLDAGVRTPRGILTGNVIDLGNYYQCLGIHRPITNSVVEGKYCMINVPLDQNWPSLPSIPTWPDEWPDIPWPGQNLRRFRIKEDAVRRSRDYQLATAEFKAFNGADNIDKRIADTPLAALTFRLGTCIPKACTPRTALKALFNRSEILAIDFEEAYCRLPNDKLWVTGEYVAFSIFGFFILLVVISTGYDIRYNVYQNKESVTTAKDLQMTDGTNGLMFFTVESRYLKMVIHPQNDLGKRYLTLEIDPSGCNYLATSCSILPAFENPKKNIEDPKKINKLLIAFSAYTNTRRLVTYTPVPGALECLDGIRSFAMMWVIIGHTFVTQTSSEIMANPADAFTWMMSLQSIWITAAPITVDTFFMLSGLLLVYTTAGKLTSMKLVKSLHLFYLNRLLRMFPVLAAVVLLQISILNRVSDGPYWTVISTHTQRCRVNWWSTLLYIQNYINPNHMCLAHSWYLAIDVQLHILSPLVLVWVLTGKRKLAWSALIGALIAVLAAATTYNFIKEFQSGPIIPSRPRDAAEYLTNYYVNTLPRASPFFVGLIFGYLLHLNRGKKVTLNLITSSLLWICTTVIALLVIYSSYPIMQLDWDNQIADSMINSFMRPAWAVFVGWLIFACAHGYGGPVNWILSLQAWKVLSRLSYAMYLVHYPLMFVINAMPVVPIYFNVRFSLFQFLADFLLAVIVSYIVTIIVDAPCSVLIKHFMGGGPKRPAAKIMEPELIEEKKTKL